MAENKLKNPYGEILGKLIHIKDIEKGDNVICPLCKEKLIVKDGEKNQKHLSHIGDIDCFGESKIHELTKQYIYENIKAFRIEKYKLEFKYGSLEIVGDYKFNVIDKFMEYRFYEGYIPDIFLILDGNFKVAIEIYYSNKKKKDILKEKLENMNIDQVYEIKIKNEDIEDFNLEKILSKAKLIYNRIEEDYNKYFLSKKEELTNLSFKNINLESKINDLNMEKRALLKEIESLKSKDIERLRWEINMCKLRLQERTKDKGNYFIVE